MKSIKEKTKESYEALKSEFGYRNAMQAPKIVKMVISAGVGSVKDKKKLDLIEDRLSKITGQKPVRKGAKLSVAAFKVREGDTVGMQITLRGARMYDFLDRLVNIALPRTKDFRGISGSGIDEMGNYTLGIKENTIFPESSDEDLRDVFGLAVTIVTNVRDKKQTKAFLVHLGFPFKKVDTKEVKEKAVVTAAKKPKKKIVK
ncbi:MAG TPA: 50S ribosomal protein L5 [Candidatus Paceibacterota bacterium]|nr:50S ribosomal protein L5 [uncultured archaeon]